MGKKLIYEKVWPHDLIDVLAARILDDSEKTYYDFSDKVVVLPSLNTVAECSRRLVELAGSGLILPSFTTFDSWACQVAKPFEVETKRYLTLLIYHELEKHQWLERGNNWNLAADMAQLIGELNSYQPDVELDLESVNDRFNEAYQTRAQKLVGFEAKLLFDTWHAFTGVRNGRTSEQNVYRHRLSSLLKLEKRSLYVVVYPDLSPLERAFIESYSSQHCVTVLEADVSSIHDDTRADFCRSVYQNETQDGAFLNSEPTSGDPNVWKDTISYFPAVNLDQEVRAIQVQIQDWIRLGINTIAIIPFDRKVARRLRAVLQQSGILVQDEFGWKMSTTSVAAMLVDWLELLTSDIEITKLIAFLKRPILLKTSGVEELRLNLEKAFKKNRHWAIKSGFYEVAQTCCSDRSLELAHMLREAKIRFDRAKSRRHRDWIDGVLMSLEFMDLKLTLEYDDAGLQILQLLDTLRGEVELLQREVSFAAWLDWFKTQLEDNTFKDTKINSPICFTHLSAARLRCFDGIIFAGADDGNFPLSEARTPHFGDGVRAQLELRTTDDFIHADKVDLIGALLSSSNILVTWQSQKDNENNLISPWFESFRLYYTQRWGEGLIDSDLQSRVNLFDRQQRRLQAMYQPSSEPQLSLAASEIPRKISVSGYQSLLDCPYQFFIRYVLRTREPEILDFEPSNRELGNVLHVTLEKFHARHPSCVGVDVGILHREIIDITRETLETHIGISGVTHGWITRFYDLLRQYLDWQIQWEKEGWNIIDTEKDCERTFLTEGGLSVNFFGRVDRIDEKLAVTGPETMVIDYKTQGKSRLKKMISTYDENTQLLSYLSLQTENKVKAMYLSLDKDSPDTVTLEVDDVSGVVETHMSRLRDLFGKLESGEVLPANGVPSSCKYCDVKGSCRKDYSWLPK
jgi:ATP-dependent helicase/nuclease subunit B